MESLRRAARLVNQPWKYKKLVSLVESPANGRNKLGAAMPFPDYFYSK